MTGPDPSVTPPARCPICGGGRFVHTPVLWPGLVDEWGLSADEAAYIDAQQGTRCDTCQSNLRSLALALAIMQWAGYAGLFGQFVHDPRHAALRLLEVNEAGTLHHLLRILPGHRFGVYPQVDLMQLPFASGTFDLVVHSDTLEHVPDPRRALEECRRVLAVDGALVFTVPTIVGRLTRSRAGLPQSYHGLAGANDPGMAVHTEFGADVWAFVLAAGFRSCELVPCAFPAGLAIIARR